MVTFKGRRGKTVAPGPRLFIIQAEEEVEMFARELDCAVESLRSRGVFLLVLARKIIIWSGRASSQNQLSAAVSTAERWRLDTPRELGSLDILAVETLTEGRETQEFWSALKGTSADYQRLSGGDLVLTSSPQLYHMTSVLGSFEVNEVKCEYRKGGSVNNLMLDQSLLYDAEQPGTPIGNSTL